MSDRNDENNLDLQIKQPSQSANVPSAGIQPTLPQAGSAPEQNPPPASALVSSSVSSEATQKAKAAVHNAMEAFKILLSDPLNGQSQAVSSMGEPKAFQAGIVFCILFAVTSFLLADSFVFAFARKLNLSVDFMAYVKLFLSCAVMPGALLLGFIAIGKFFGGAATLQASTFGTGVSLLPVAAASLLSYILGSGNYELVMISGCFGATLSVLLLYASLVGLQKLSTQKSFILTPSLIVFSIYIAKVIHAAFSSPAASNIPPSLPF